MILFFRWGGTWPQRAPTFLTEPQLFSLTTLDGILSEAWARALGSAAHCKDFPISMYESSSYVNYVYLEIKSFYYGRDRVEDIFLDLIKINS